ncbi:hypothetical protein [Citricoccus sp. K5]|uniref:hypothetical protein n=1 Tax=Citricoccus sp. K5 TaxID=2653135 RepID=UPI0012F2AC52|nr:hypothetical protein [Citricoccus sp. K5]VXB24580.1 hypothetical protein CITRIK5_30035 [Citricoccus sp. K5]
MIALFWIAVIIGAACFVAVVIRDCLNWDGPPSHNLDCLDGVRDGTCPADHDASYYTSPRAQVELQDAFDGQIGFGK